MVSENQIIVRTLSPIVAYSTMTKYDGKKYTCYFGPDEPEFAVLVSDNLGRKHLAYRGVTLESKNGVSVTPLGRPRLSVVKFKGTVIKGYTCRLRLEGPIPLLQTAVDAGLGSKNSQGFGCVEIDTRATRTQDPTRRGENVDDY